MERKSLFAKKSAQVARPETFALKVESYDTAAKPAVVIGERLDTGEKVSVYLRDDVEYKRNGSKKRSEIADFAAPRKDRQHPGTAVGGILMVQEGTHNGNAVYGARWIQSLSHTPGEAEVFEAVIHVTPVKYGAKSKEFPQGRPYSQMTVMHDGKFGALSDEMADALKLTPPFKVDSVKELQEAVGSLLNDGVGVGVRVSSGEAFDALYVSRKKDQKTEDAVSAFMENVADMAEAIDKGEMTVEVIPYGNLWAGKATLDVMAANKVVQSRLTRFNEVAEGNNGRTYPVSLFRPALVAVRLTKADDEGRKSAYFTHFEPLYNRFPVKGLVNAIAYAESEHLAPVPPRPEDKAGAASQESAPGDVPAEAGSPAAADSGFGSFGGDDFVDEDVMGAATGEPTPAPQPKAEAEPAAEAAPAGRNRYAGRRR